MLAGLFFVCIETSRFKTNMKETLAFYLKEEGKWAMLMLKENRRKKPMESNYDKQVDIGKSYFLRYDAGQLAKKFKLPLDEEFLYLTYFGSPFRIERESGTVFEKQGEEYLECRSYETVMTIYDMLCHNPELPPVPLSGNWTLVGNFAAAGASPSADFFAQKYADFFSGKTEKLKKACKSLGGELQPRLAGADVTARIPAFPFFPVLLQFWERDDEFPPQLKILWDTQTMHYLNFETTYYLQGDLLERLRSNIISPETDTGKSGE